ncbi:hypothetical protein OH492_00905 [Vibrio chagasii]|nr:hypothetical protein [Vibrio chagasii]
MVQVWAFHLRNDLHYFLGQHSYIRGFGLFGKVLPCCVQKSECREMIGNLALNSLSVFISLHNEGNGIKIRWALQRLGRCRSGIQS